MFLQLAICWLSDMDVDVCLQLYCRYGNFTQSKWIVFGSKGIRQFHIFRFDASFVSVLSSLKERRISSKGNEIIIHVQCYTKASKYYFLSFFFFLQRFRLFTSFQIQNHQFSFSLVHYSVFFFDIFFFLKRVQMFKSSLIFLLTSPPYWFWASEFQLLLFLSFRHSVIFNHGHFNQFDSFFFFHFEFREKRTTTTAYDNVTHFYSFSSIICNTLSTSTGTLKQIDTLLLLRPKQNIDWASWTEKLIKNHKCHMLHYLLNWKNDTKIVYQLYLYWIHSIQCM